MGIDVDRGFATPFVPQGVPPPTVVPPDCFCLMHHALPNSTAHVVFAGGGTGGHLFPGLAVAEELRRTAPEVRITLAGSGSAFERQHVGRAGFDYLPLDCRPLSRSMLSRGVLLRRPWHAIGFVAANLRGYRSAVRFLSEQPADAVVGLGGYASVPMAWAAVGQHVPLVLLEQNAVAGLATRWLAPSATLVCVALAESQSEIERYLTPRTRQAPRHRHADPPHRPTPPPRDVPTLAAGIGREPRGAVAERPRSLCAGAKRLAATHLARLAPNRRRGSRPGASCVPQTGHPRHGYAVHHRDAAGAAQADLAVCRAGGSTLAELAAAGVPAVVVPYPHAAADHQRKNAAVLTAVGACTLIDSAQRRDDDFETALADAVTGLLWDDRRRWAMRAAMLRLGTPDAARHVADLVLSLIEERARRAA